MLRLAGVDYISTSRLRYMKSRDLKALESPLVVHDYTRGENVAVLVPIALYLKLQEKGIICNPLVDR